MSDFEVEFFDNTPPADPVTIPLEEYDRLKAAVTQVLDAHVVLRRVRPLVHGEPVDEDELADLRLYFDHFTREFL